jgi:predicted nuclease of predicted toxin-antitoxin system
VRFKLDENLPERLVELFAGADYDATTVRGEGISGYDDQALYEHCQDEQRVLVTLDMDFANPLSFPPESAVGLIVLRPPRPLLSLIREMLAGVMVKVETEPLSGKLWIVEPGRLRIYEPNPESSEGK